METGEKERKGVMKIKSELNLQRDDDDGRENDGASYIVAPSRLLLLLSSYRIVSYRIVSV